MRALLKMEIDAMDPVHQVEETDTRPQLNRVVFPRGEADHHCSRASQR